MVALYLLEGQTGFSRRMKIGGRAQSPAGTTRATPVRGFETLSSQTLGTALSRALRGCGFAKVMPNGFDEEDRLSGAASEAPLLLRK